MTDEEESLKMKSKYKLKKLMEHIQSIKGRHTELVTVYIPAGANLHDVVSTLRNEQGTADNIKSKPVRKNVTTALDKIVRHLGLYRKTPDHGLAIFCGNISEKEGVADINLWAIEPPEPVKTKLYWCDQTFVVDPLMEMVAEKEIYGIICMDKNEADIALLKGKKIETIAHFESIVPGKTRAGGQSSARFSRIREGLLNDWMKHVAEACNKIFIEHKEVIGIILSGSGPIKEMMFKEDYLFADVKKRIIGTVDTSYTGEHGLQETIVRAEDLLKETAITKEKKIVQKFLTELQKPHGLAIYGLETVIEYLEKGTVDTVLLCDVVDKKYVELECACGMTKKFLNDFEKNKQICTKCNRQMRVLGEMDLIDFFEEKNKDYGSNLTVVTRETREGEQFFQLGGVGAFLRYRA